MESAVELEKLDTIMAMPVNQKKSKEARSALRRKLKRRISKGLPLRLGTERPGIPREVRRYMERIAVDQAVQVRGLAGQVELDRELLEQAGTCGEMIRKVALVQRCMREGKEMLARRLAEQVDGVQLAYLGAAMQRIQEAAQAQAEAGGWTERLVGGLIRLSRSPEWTVVNLGFSGLVVRSVADVVLEDDGLSVDLGLVTFHFGSGVWGPRRTRSPYVSLQKSDCSGQYVHPHVASGGSPCWGDAGWMLDAAMKRGDVLETLAVLWAWVTTYNPASPYRKLRYWTGAECTRCGGFVSRENIEGRACESCGEESTSMLCRRCSAAQTCKACGGPRCTRCQRACNAMDLAGEYLCEGYYCCECIQACMNCGVNTCSGHQIGGTYTSSFNGAVLEEQTWCTRCDAEHSGAEGGDNVWKRMEDADGTTEQA